MFNEQLGYASVQGVEAFDQPGLNGPFALQPLLKLPVCPLRTDRAASRPGLRQRVPPWLALRMIRNLLSASIDDACFPHKLCRKPSNQSLFQPLSWIFLSGRVRSIEGQVLRVSWRYPILMMKGEPTCLKQTLSWRFQRELFPWLEEALGPLGERYQRLVRVLELMRVEESCPTAGAGGAGRWRIVRPGAGLRRKR